MMKSVIVGLVMRKLKVGRVRAETISDVLIQADFPLNGITSYQSVLVYLDNIKSLRATQAARAARMN